MAAPNRENILDYIFGFAFNLEIDSLTTMSPRRALLAVAAAGGLVFLPGECSAFVPQQRWGQQQQEQHPQQRRRQQQQQRDATAPWVNEVTTVPSPASRAWTKTPALEPWWGGDDDTSAMATLTMQEADFAEGLWGLAALPAPEVPEPPEGDDHVRITIYSIGGAMTGVLGKSVNKEFPLIPHVGVRVRGREHFYSDHVEERPSAVMNALMPAEQYQQITLDIGTTDKDDAAIEAWLKEAEGSFNAENYDLWKRNCNHFAEEFVPFLLPDLEQERLDVLLKPVLDFTDSMLDNLPEWRQNLGTVFMNQLSRLVVVSWGRVVKDEKEKTADALGVSRGA